MPRNVGYDGLRRPVQLRHLRADNSLVVGFTHAYDRMDNKLTESKLHDPTNSETYAYDSAYRLIDFDRLAVGSIAPLHSDWALDGVGNWQSVTSTEAGPPTTETREHSSFNEITQRSDGGTTTILSDDNGNESDDGTFTFEWDHLNRLRTATRKSDGLVVATYSYDAMGRRIRKVVTNSGALDGTTDFYLDGSQEIEERDGADALTQQYVFGIYIDEPLVLDRNLDADNSATGLGDQRLFYHQNTLFNVYALTDATAKIVEGYQYEAYGRQTVYAPGANTVVDFGGDDVVTPGGVSLLANSYLFTGRRLDPETKLYYYRARLMDPVQGRFISRDPIGHDAGDENLYVYVGNMVTKALDPTGTRIYAKSKKAADALVKYFKSLNLVGATIGSAVSAGDRYEIKIYVPAGQEAKLANWGWGEWVLKAGQTDVKNFHIEVVDESVVVTDISGWEEPHLPRSLEGEWEVTLCVDAYGKGDKKMHAWIRLTQGTTEYTIGRVIGFPKVEWDADTKRPTDAELSMKVKDPVLFYGSTGPANNCVTYACVAFQRITKVQLPYLGVATPPNLVSLINLIKNPKPPPGTPDAAFDNLIAGLWWIGSKTAEFLVPD